MSLVSGIVTAIVLYCQSQHTSPTGYYLKEIQACQLDAYRCINPKFGENYIEIDKRIYACTIGKNPGAPK